MDYKKLSLKILPERMAVCRFDASEPLPKWLDVSDFYSVTRTRDELTVVCREDSVVPGTVGENGWRCIGVQGVLDFSEIGIIFTITQPLAKNGVSVFVISTYDTDYFLVKEKELPKTIDALTAAGHRIDTEDPSSF